MGKVYKDQTYLKIRASTGVNLTDAAVTRIYYKKPVSEDIGYVDAEVQDAATGIIFYDLSDDSDETFFIDEAGVWEFWAYIEFNDGRVARGESFKVKIYEDNME